MSFDVLTTDNPRWGLLIERLPQRLRDLHFTQGYGRIYEDVYGFKARLAVLENENGFIIQPFVEKPLRDLTFMKGKDEAYCDISNPYGYGGPLANCESIKSDFAVFYNAFHDWCVENDIPAEFCSLHPLISDWQRPMVEPVQPVTFQKNIYSLPLTPDFLTGFSQGHRRNYKIAIKNNVRVEKMPMTQDVLSRFQELYLHTMQRQGATERWMFPDTYFPACHKYLGDGGSTLFFGWVGDELASACFLIHGFDTAYYHFGGSDERFHQMRASNLVMTEAIRWAQENGYKSFHFGGGVSSDDDDPLAQFKRGFGAQKYPLHTYGRIHSDIAYNLLREYKLSYEEKIQQNIGNPDYFPIYRR